MRELSVALVLALGCALPSQSSEPSKQPSVVRCGLPNGTKLVLDYSGLTIDRENPTLYGSQMDFYTSADIVSGKGTIIPFGIYKVATLHTSNRWTLVMKQVADNGISPPQSSTPLLLKIPMSTAKRTDSSTRLTISLDQIAKTCALRIEWQESQASLEFAANGYDLSAK